MIKNSVNSHKIVNINDHNSELNIHTSLHAIKMFILLNLNATKSSEKRQIIINTARKALQERQKISNHDNYTYFINEYSNVSIDYDLLYQFKSGDNKKHMDNICKPDRDSSAEIFTSDIRYTKPAQELKSLIEELEKPLNCSNIIKMNPISKAEYLAERNLYHYNIQLAPDNQLPPRLENLNKIKNIRYGDLHGNFRKLIDHFYRAGIVNIQQNDYTQLINSPDLMISYIEDDRIQINQEVANLPLTIILAGDIFADRNSHDGAKLDFLLFLSKNNIKFKIIWSNHDEIFYKYFLQAIGGTPLSHKYKHRSRIIDSNTQDNFDKFKSLIDRNYCLIDYTNGIFFSHAPVPARLFDQLVIAYKINDSLTAEEKIVQLNHDFKTSAISGGTTSITNFHEFIWIRKIIDNKAYSWAVNDKNMVEAYPETIKYQYSGHDQYNVTKTMSSLDNVCGKHPNYPSETEIISIEKYY